MSYAKANGHRLQTARLTIPRIGAWVADVHTDDEAQDLGGILSVGTLVLEGRQMRGEAWQGSTRARLVGGYGGWRTALPARYYASAGGVRRTALVADAARECGEVLVDSPAELVVGLNYSRPAQQASATLYGLGLEWRVTELGGTSFAPWPTGLIGSPFDVTGYDATRDVVTVATEDTAAWLPGRTFVNPRLPGRTFRISTAVHVVEPERVRVELWCEP